MATKQNVTHCKEVEILQDKISDAHVIKPELNGS